MTRTEQINNEAIAYECAIVNDDIGKCYNLRDAFAKGACWADMHPTSKYNLSDADFVYEILESIIQETEMTTIGNVAHNVASIRLKAESALNMLTNDKNRKVI